MITDSDNEMYNGFEDDDAVCQVGQKRKLTVKPHKGKVVRSLTQGLGLLASGMKRLAESQAVRHKKEMEENHRRDELFLKFREDDKQQDREHEMRLTRMMMEFQRENSASQASGFTPQFTPECQHYPPYIQTSPQGTSVSHPITSLSPPVVQLQNRFQGASHTESQTYTDMLKGSEQFMFK